MANTIETIKNWSNKKKLIIALSLVLGIAAIVLLFSWSQSTNYAILFSNLSEADAGKMVEKLQQMKVPYQVTSNSVMVPAEKVYDLRLQMAAQGLPQGGGIGFEVFDKTDFQATDFVQKLNYKRALEGELARTITALGEVDRARVHLAMPEKSLFVKDKQPPTASILITLKPSRSLTQGQIQGIVHLVSSSIEGLNPNDVTIVDSSGNMLTRHADEVMGLTSTQLEYQRKYEKDIEASVREILEPVVGKDKVKVKVNTDLDFSRTEMKEEKYDPDGEVVRSRQTSSEESVTQQPAGVVGVQSNLPAKTTPQSQGGQQQTKKLNETINNEITKVTSHIIAPYGKLKKLTAAVLVDGIYTAKADSKDPKDVVYTPHKEEDLKQYENLVKKAIGFTEKRGDEVTVINMPFEPLQKEEIAPVKRTYADYLKDGVMVVKYLAPVLLALLFVAFVVRPIVKSLVQESMPTVKELPYSRTVGDADDDGRKALAGKEKGMKMPPTEEMTIKREMSGWSDWVKDNPTQAAVLIKEWMSSAAEEPS
ncbi:flagellar basal-body MS-ring/collar protein FliF [Candidatus Magnetominusculus xianensis]|uniref:Flagellar M-ring protein n=1 Tax=Candidatus Magnetominusculus xianensis TaxID=1748249 RepID=A0ABR5SEV8_9BACT|nr:flagellar basal-body MS-ring/collar protein FliF [Candidatus Magnetominusculus xianensis]KWT85140.1 flagellar M-ring protein FliF [Candidatus Magnetominusculus xianensis]MBF0405398.1 flagellar M-ring protein FliF [Nitrospirota bacterium]